MRRSIARLIEHLLKSSGVAELFSLEWGGVKEWYNAKRGGIAVPHIDAEYLKGNYLHTTGWWKSFYTQVPVSQSGAFLPLYSYAAIRFLDGKLYPNLCVLDSVFGTSTLYYIGKGPRRVVSIAIGQNPLLDRLELGWAKIIQIHNIETPKALPTAIRALKERFHIVAVGTTERMRCIQEGLKALHEDGVLILNDSDSEDAKEGIAYLHKQGFKHIHFQELRPLGYELFSTSIFYRDKNCLGI